MTQIFSFSCGQYGSEPEIPRKAYFSPAAFDLFESVILLVCVFGVVGCVCVLGTMKEDKKYARWEWTCGTILRQFDGRKKAPLFPFFFWEKLHRRESGESEFFHFFFLRFFFDALLSSFSLFSLSFLSSSLCVFFCSRILSTQINFLAAAQSSNHHRNLSSLYKSKHNNTLFAFYGVNAQKNKNRTRFKAESERELLFDRL